jgi:hypothetical protein
MNLTQIIDKLLCLLPGSRSDPTSLEARVRRATTAAALVLQQAKAHEAKVINQVQDDAHEMVQVQIQSITFAIQRLEQYKGVVRPEERTQLLNLVKSLDSTLAMTSTKV